MFVKSMNNSVLWANTQEWSVNTLTEQEKRQKRVCFTGHRPERLHASEATVKKALASEIELAYQDGFRTFITGMARGVDIWAAELVLEFRSFHDDVHLICAVPFPEMEKSWKSEWQQRYTRILEHADLTRTICSSYSKASYILRNEWMVDHSARVIAAFDGSQEGGTYRTIQYALKNSVTVRYVGLE